MHQAKLKIAAFTALLSAALCLPASSAGLPDLCPGRPRLVFSPAAADEVLLIVPIENRGAGASAPAMLHVGWRGDPASEWAWSVERLNPIPPGGNAPLRLRLPLTAETGRAALTVAVDPDGMVEEENEGNNELFIGAVAALVPAPRLEPIPAAWSGEVLKLEGTTGPGWGVEALAGGVVAARAAADGEGHFALEIPLAPGMNRLSARAVLGGVWAGTAGAVRQVYRDSTPPEVTVSLPREGGSYQVLRPLYSVADELPVAVSVTLDGQEHDGGEIAAPGRHVLRITARDAAGNLASVARSFTITAPDAGAGPGREPLKPNR